MHRLRNRIEYRQRECAALTEQLKDKQLNENQRRYRRQKKARFEREISELQHALKTRTAEPLEQEEAEESSKQLPLQNSPLVFTCPSCGMRHEYYPSCMRQESISKPDFDDFAK
jgi:hypothetical protein